MDPSHPQSQHQTGPESLYMWSPTSSNASDISRISSAPSSPGPTTPRTSGVSDVDLNHHDEPERSDDGDDPSSQTHTITSQSPILDFKTPQTTTTYKQPISIVRKDDDDNIAPAKAAPRHRQGLSLGHRPALEPIKTARRLSLNFGLPAPTTTPEAAAAVSPPPPPPSSVSSPAVLWILAYFVFNMGLTFYNKTVLVHFPYPFTLTALHTLCGTIGCVWARRVGYYTPASLTSSQKFTLGLFSVLYTFNIAISNLSLQLVSVPFHQVVRASSPIFTILVAWLLRRGGGGGGSRGRRKSGILGVGHKKLLSLIPVIAGVGFATYGDYSFTAWGLILTLFGTFLAALKTVLTSILQTAPASSRLLPTTSSPSPSHSHSIDFLKSGSDVNNTPGTTLSFLEAKAKAKAESEQGRERKSFVLPPSTTNMTTTPSFVSRVFPPSPTTFPSTRPESTTTTPGWSFLTKRFDLDFQPVPAHHSDHRGGNNGVFGRSMSMIKLHPLDLLARMSPLAFAQCLVYAVLSGEARRLIVGTGMGKGLGGGGGGSSMALVLGLNGIIAFALNVVSLTANQKNGPLTMTVAANVKQVLTILLAMSFFNVHISLTNALGITFTLFGGAWYAALEYQTKRDRLRTETVAR